MRRRDPSRFGRLVRSAGAALVFAALARAVLALLPGFVDAGALTSRMQSWIGFLPEPLSTGAGELAGFLSSQLARWPSYRDAFAGADTFPLWLIVGGLGSLLFVLGQIVRRNSREKAGDAPASSSVAPGSGPAPGFELSTALRSCRGALAGVAVFSGVSNALMLTGAIFMLQVYDRVLPSRSVPTLVALSILAGVLFMGQAIIDLLRGRVMTRIGAELDEVVGRRVYRAMTSLHLSAGRQADGLQPQRDLESIRAFLSSPGPNALFELPWLPLYLAIIWSFHSLLGITATCGAAVLVALTVTTELLTRKPTSAAALSAVRRNRYAEAGRRNGEVLAAMGMTKRLYGLWREASREHLGHQQWVSDVAGGLGSFSRALRLMLQSAMLGAGAWLVIHGQATAGIIIAASILAGRALAPVDLAIAHWRNFVSARQSWHRLSQLLARLPHDTQPMALPAPSSKLTVERVTIAPPGVQRVVVQGVEFGLSAGAALGVIGPSGSGKSTLARTLVGAWRPLAGRIRLDGASLDQWSPERLGRHIGYLPQDVELISGTVAANISRFDPEAGPEAIVEAAKAAGVHELIVNLPNGYETQIGEDGAALSAGQRQRIALARALYGDPFLVVLDEPNSNLDVDGEAALVEAIRNVKSRAGIAVIVTHRPDILATADYLLVLRQGQMEAFGSKERVLARPPAPRPGGAHIGTPARPDMAAFKSIEKPQAGQRQRA